MPERLAPLTFVAMDLAQRLPSCNDRARVQKVRLFCRLLKCQPTEHFFLRCSALSIDVNIDTFACWSTKKQHHPPDGVPTSSAGRSSFVRVDSVAVVPACCVCSSLFAVDDVFPALSEACKYEHVVVRTLTGIGRFAHRPRAAADSISVNGIDNPELCNGEYAPGCCRVLHRMYRSLQVCKLYKQLA